jgi:hypothetical protein
MMRRLTFLTGFAAGYVLGARAGRERYEQIMRMTRSFASNPTVQQTAGMAKAQAGDMSHKAMHQAGDLAGMAKGKAKDKVGATMHRHGSANGSDMTMGSSTVGSTVADGMRASDSAYVVDEHMATGTGVTGTNDRMGL